MKGMDAMASSGANPRLAQLWQAPLLLLSVGLFGTAAYLFINPGPGLTIDQRIHAARIYLNYQRPEAALDQLNRLISSEKLSPQNDARIRLMLAESLEQAQKQHHISIATNHDQIIEQTRLALAEGLKPDADLYRRLGESYEALGHPDDALESYRRAMAVDPRRFPNLQRKVIELQLKQSDTGPAEASIEEYLREPNLAESERAWGLRQKSRLLIERGSFIDAKALLDESLRLSGDLQSQGEANYWLGYSMWKLGDAPEAERFLRVARDQLKVANPLDADAAYLLGKLRQDQNDPREAISFYQVVLASHPEAPAAMLARLARGECRITLGQEAGGLSDLHEVAHRIAAEAVASKDKPMVLAGLRQSAAILTAQERYQSALELLQDEKTLDSDPPADFFERLAAVYERLADQVDHTVADASDAVEKISRQQQVRKFRTLAADAYVSYSRSLTVSDDKAHAQAMWKAVDLYDRAGNLQMVTSALELFAAERPQDGQTPDALLRLGRAYQAMGLFDKAVAVFERNQRQYPQSLAASKSGVPLAQAYIAKGADSYPRAEKVLLGVLDSPILGPDAEEFKQSLFELAQLYYRTGRFEEAVVRLDEMTQRYPRDPRMPQLLFLIADSYRKSAAALMASRPADAQAGQSSQAAQAEVVAARKDRLAKARNFYDRLISMYPEASPPGDLDKLYLKLAYFYRADCLFDLHDYTAAIGAYDSAATRYEDDPSALSAYVQIVNAYCEQRKFPEAKHANERAMTLLSRMPSEAFNDGAFSMPKAYWQQWLKWTNDAGLWNGLEDEKQAAERFANMGMGG